jgi:hypothetical protein
MTIYTLLLVLHMPYVLPKKKITLSELDIMMKITAYTTSLTNNGRQIDEEEMIRSLQHFVFLVLPVKRVETT